MNFNELCKEVSLYPEKYYLFQYINDNEFCFTVLDIEKIQYLVFKRFVFDPEKDIYINIEKIINKEELLNKNFAKRYLLVSSTKSTLIPALFFSEKDIKTYFQFVHQLSDYDELNYTFVPSIRSYNVFSINSELINLLNKNQKSIVFHSNHVTIETIMQVINKNDCIYTYFNNNILEVALKERNELRYFNQFVLIDNSDFLYYIKLIYEQLKIGSENLNFFYSGNSSYEQSIIKYINSYFKKPLIVEINWPEVNEKIGEDIKYKYFNLLYLYNCELLVENIKEEY